jgi:hypothetical protein
VVAASLAFHQRLKTLLKTERYEVISVVAQRFAVFSVTIGAWCCVVKCAPFSAPFAANLPDAAGCPRSECFPQFSDFE